MDETRQEIVKHDKPRQRKTSEDKTIAVIHDLCFKSPKNSFLEQKKDWLLFFTSIIDK